MDFYEFLMLGRSVAPSLGGHNIYGHPFIAGPLDSSNFKSNLQKTLKILQPFTYSIKETFRTSFIVQVSHFVDKFIIDCPGWVREHVV